MEIKNLGEKYVVTKEGNFMPSLTMFGAACAMVLSKEVAKKIDKAIDVQPLLSDYKSYVSIVDDATAKSILLNSLGDIEY